MNTRLISALTCAAILTPGAVAAQASGRMPVTDLKPLLKLAIERGSASGVIVGASASYVRDRFGTGAPLEVDVRALHALPQVGCSRLEVATTQRDVMEGGKPSDKALTYQVSYCIDGRFPDAK